MTSELQDDGKALENPVFLQNTPYLYSYQDTPLPIESDEELNDFLTMLSSVDHDTPKLNNLLNGLTAIKDRETDDNKEGSPIWVIVIDHNPEYYYKVYSSLFTKSYHDQLLSQSNFFAQLHRRASRAKFENNVHIDDVQKSAEFATENWHTDSSQLHDLYEKIRANRNHEYINLIDDNSTLLRQAQLNRDMLLRRQFVNTILNSLLLTLSLFIITGYLSMSLGYSLPTIMTINLLIVILFGIRILMAILTENRRHELNFTRISPPGYPVHNLNVQAKYTQGASCGTQSNPNTCETQKCTGLK
tara:strand:+ start:10993 stop:11898 length:906 start_codon:yes stop_codon:yes gene_type:complete